MKQERKIERIHTTQGELIKFSVQIEITKQPELKVDNPLMRDEAKLAEKFYNEPSGKLAGRFWMINGKKIFEKPNMKVILHSEVEDEEG